MQLAVGICDDCEMHAELIEQYLNSNKGEDSFSIIKSTDPEDFFKKIEFQRPNLVFLDIDMEKMNGIQLGEKIKGLYKNIVIIYITAYEKYALEAFMVRAFNYLIKPLTKETFMKALEEALALIKRNNNSPDKIFTIKKKGETTSLRYNEIIYFEKIAHKIRIYTLRDIREFYDNFTSLIEIINPDDFIQCHQGYIVNVEKIRSFRDKTLYMDGGLKVPVSRTFTENVHIALAKRLFDGKESI